jgi:putative oxidoreductase
MMFIAGPIEFFGGILIMIGLWTPWVAFICSGQMAYAYWSVHGTHALLPLMNGGEWQLFSASFFCSLQPGDQGY